MEPFAIYRDYQKALEYNEQQQKDNWFDRLRNADKETLEGYVKFGGGPEAIKDEPESDKPF